MMLCGGTTAERRIGGGSALSWWHSWWHSVRARCEQKLPAGGYSLEAAEKPAEDLGVVRAQNGEVKRSRGLLEASQEGWRRTRGADKPGALDVSGRESSVVLRVPSVSREPPGGKETFVTYTARIC